MCGLFGYLSKTGRGPDLDRLRRIALETQIRGAHAFGLVWVAPDGKLHVFKRPGSAAANLDALDRCRDALIVAGHCRYATHGDPADNRNNHPHRAGRGWLVHNGIVRNHASIARRYGLVPETECDSEVLGLLMAKVPGSLQRRAAIGVDATDGPLALLGVWTRPARLLLVRRGNPLWIGETRTGAYFGSLPGELPEGARPVPEGYAMVHTLDDRLLVSQIGSRNAGLPRVAVGGSRRLRMAARPSGTSWDNNTMTEKDWDLFCELLEKLVSQPGSWKEKKEAVEAEASRRGADTALEEFAGWFSE